MHIRIHTYEFMTNMAVYPFLELHHYQNKMLYEIHIEEKSPH